MLLIQYIRFSLDMDLKGGRGPGKGRTLLVDEEMWAMDDSWSFRHMISIFERKYFDLCSNRSGQSSIAWVMWCVVERKYRYRRWWGRSHALLSHHQVKWYLRYVSAFRSKRSETHLVRLILAASQQHNRRILFYRFIGIAPAHCPQTPGRGTELSTTPTPLNFRNQMEISRCTK